MKNQMYRIRKNMERWDEQPIKRETKEEDESNPSQISDLINVLQNLVAQGAGITSKNGTELDIRDRHPIVAWNSARRNAISDRQLQVWITNVCRTTFSTAFNYYYTDQLSYELTRVFCTETIIKNVVRLTQKMKLTSSQVKILDEYIQFKILPYMQKKYPLTGETDINKALESVVEEINSFNQLQNDFIYLTKTKFAYRKSGNYNDLIMIVLNRVLQTVDNPSNTTQQSNQALSNYRYFESTMAGIFQSVEDQGWVNARNSSKPTFTNKEEKEKEKYKEKVKSYTSYLIGRKVSENVDLFKETAIANEHLVVHHSSILRILTKWCQQLEGKFTNANYMKEHLENIETLGGDINTLNDEHRENLDEKLHTQMVFIGQYLSKLKDAFYNEQSLELLKHLQVDNNNYIEPYEKAFGKFSCQTVKNLHTFIIKYLNRLIHGLVKVALDWHRESGYKNNFQKWSYPPNLVTFKIGDLIRCKCSSKQQEILAIFNELNSISNHNPEKLKIVRIKNRLKSQTNDILINVKFNNCLIGEIQLAVNSKKSKFAQCSNNFSHYLYQLQRCLFGPFSELANIWKNIDIRSKEFEQIIRSQGRAQIGREEIMKIDKTLDCNTSNGHQYVSYDLPFRCNFCRNYHSHNDVIIPNVQCLKCFAYKCMRCQVQSISQQELKIKILGKKYDELGRKAELVSQQMPNYGFFVHTDARMPQIQYFKEYKINGLTYFLGKKKGKIYQIVKNDETAIRNFFYHNLVFKLKEETDSFIRMTNQQVKQSYILPEYVQGIYKSEKVALFLNQKKINPQKWPEILDNKKYESSVFNIKKIEISNNELRKIDFVCKIFPNLKSIESDNNVGCTIQQIVSLAKLQHICMQSSEIAEIPKSISSLKNLQELNLYRNNISFVPRQIFSMESLKILNLKYNLLTELPQEVGNLKNLNQLLIRANNIASIPDCIENLKNLTILNIGKCGMKALNPKIGGLTSLKILDLAVNEFSELPETFSNLINLQKLKMQENKFCKIPAFVSKFTKLLQFKLYSNQIQQICIQFSQLSVLDILNISKNPITLIDKSFTGLKALTEFYMHDTKYNKLQMLSELTELEDLSLDLPSKDSTYSIVPKQICFLSNLLTLKLRTAQTRILMSPAIKNLTQLQELNLSRNKLVQIPKQIALLASLQKMYLDGNSLEFFPIDYLPHLAKLQEVNLKGNRLKKVPKQLINTLKVLNLSNNLITEVEIQDTANKNLIKLRLRQNKLQNIPKNIKYLKRLKQLDLSYNKIQSLQENLNELRNVESLSFHIYGNPIKYNKCQNFIQSQTCEESKIFINSLVTELKNLEI